MIENLLDHTELNKKLEKLKMLSTMMQLREGQTLTGEQQTAIDDWQTKMTFRLDSLVMETKLKEADIRIEIFEEIVKLIQNK